MSYLYEKLFGKLSQVADILQVMTGEQPVGDFADGIVAAWRTELPEVESLPLELVKRVARLAGRIEMVTAAELDRLDLTKAEYEVLATLRGAGSPYRLRPTGLSTSVSLSSGGTTNVLHRLVARGLVAREAHPEDRRGSAVRLTPEGVRAAEAAVLATNAAHRELLGPLDEAAARTLADQLRLALRALDAPGRRSR
jgi:DNA-binding MarR family transcriptional regulator